MLTRQMSYCAERGALTAARPQSACRSCSLSGACGATLLERVCRTDVELRLDRYGESAPAAGAEFTVRMPAASFLRICATLFPGLALLTLGGSWFASLINPAGGEVAAVAGAAAGLVVGALMLRLYDSRLESRGPGSRLVIEPSGRVSESDS